MPTYYDENLDEEYRVCNKHHVESCEICTPRFCCKCGERMDDDNPESEISELCEKCFKEGEQSDD